MKRLLLITLLMLLAALPTLAQSDCSNNLPCGGVPWRLPALPVLRSPTPFPTVIATSAAGFIPTSTGTVTPTPSATSAIDVASLNNSMATMSVALQVTQPAIGAGRSDFDMGNAGGQLIGYILGLQNVHFGVFTPFVTFFFFAFFAFFGTKIVGILLPVISAIVGVVRKIIDVILQFIPG
jgi:hypothetical protein